MVARRLDLLGRYAAHQLVAERRDGRTGGPFQIELPANRQDRITNRFGFEPARGRAPELTVLGIDLHVPRVAIAAELIGSAEHDRADHAFDRPTVVGELQGERVEQKRMTRLLADHPEIVDAGDQTTAKQVMPNAIDHHARRQWIVCTRDPLGQFQATAVSGVDLGRIRHLHGRHESARRDFTLLAEVAADSDMGIGRLGPVADTHRVPRTWRTVLLEFRRVGLKRNRYALRCRHVLDRLLQTGNGLIQRFPCRWVGRGSFPQGCGLRSNKLRGLGLGCRREFLRLGGLFQFLARGGEFLFGFLDLLFVVFRGDMHGVGIRADRKQIGRVVAVLLLDRAVPRLGAQKDPRQRIVVLGWNRVELVIVATGTADGHCQRRAKDGVNLVVDDVHPKLRSAGVVSLGTKCQQARSDSSRFDRFGRIVLAIGQQVARDLLTEEYVVGLVLIQRVDHIVAVGPGMRIGEVEFHAARFRIANHVEPMTAPTLAKPGRIKQLVDQVRQRFR